MVPLPTELRPLGLVAGLQVPRWRRLRQRPEGPGLRRRPEMKILGVSAVVTGLACPLALARRHLCGVSIAIICTAVVLGHLFIYFVCLFSNTIDTIVSMLEPRLQGGPLWSVIPEEDD